MITPKENLASVKHRLFSQVHMDDIEIVSKEVKKWFPDTYEQLIESAKEELRNRLKTRIEIVMDKLKSGPIKYGEASAICGAVNICNLKKQGKIIKYKIKEVGKSPVFWAKLP